MVDVLIGIHSQHDNGIIGVDTDAMTDMIKTQIIYIDPRRLRTDIRCRADLTAIVICCKLRPQTWTFSSVTVASDLTEW